MGGGATKGQQSFCRKRNDQVEVSRRSKPQPRPGQGSVPVRSLRPGPRAKYNTYYTKLGSIPLRNWIFLLIRIQELELNWLNRVRAELELPLLELELESELRSTEVRA